MASAMGIPARDMDTAEETGKQAYCDTGNYA